MEAAAWRGLPVALTITEDTPAQDPSSAAARTSRSNQAQLLFAIFLLVGEAILAYRNVRMGRGDARGSLRLGAVVAILAMLYKILSQSHALDSAEYGRILQSLGESLLSGGRMAAAYLAFEPFIRRRWPNVLISWTRVLAGSFKDPLVGRHWLIGMCGGGFLAVVYKSYDLLVGPSSTGSRDVDLYQAANTARILGQLCRSFGDAIGDAAWATFLVFVFALLFRNRWAAAAFAALLWSGVQAAGSPIPLYTVTLWLVIFGVLFWLLFQYGLLAACAYALSGEILMGLPMTFDTGAWYFGASALALVVLCSGAFYAYRTAMGGRPIWTAS